MSRKRLGKGLGALFSELESGPKDAIVEIELDQVRPNPEQPRREFDAARLEELAASIRQHGVVQPIIVRQQADGYLLVAGERRYRAAQLAGLGRVPALVRELTEEQSMEIALIENLQREDLNPLEEAQAYRTLLERFRLTQEDLAQRLGRSRSQIANTLRLLLLPPELQEQLRAGRLSMGHAKVLLSLSDPDQQLQLAERVHNEALSVRALEEAVARGSTPRRAVRRKAAGRAAGDSDLQAVEQHLREVLGTPVRITPGTPRGKIEIDFFGPDDLLRLIDLLVPADSGATTPQPPRPFSV